MLPAEVLEEMPLPSDPKVLDVGYAWRDPSCPCSRLVRSSVTAFGRWVHLATFLKGKSQSEVAS